VNNIFTTILGFSKEVIDKWRVIYELTRRNFQSQYTGSYLGFVWVFLQPLLFISVLYFVFTFGFRTRPSGDYPFSVYLISGMIAWLFFSNNLSSCTHVIREFSFLVKKVDFRLSILPIVKLSSSLITHLFFVAIALIVALVSGISVNFYFFQIFYYMIAMNFLLLGLGWITSSTSIFVKDIGNIVTVVIQFGFWLTPIFWNIELISTKYQWIIKLNPMYYIVTGYRDSIIYKVPFWVKPYETMYYWCLTLFVLFSGMVIFRRLKPHFAEVV